MVSTINIYLSSFFYSEWTFALINDCTLEEKNIHRFLILGFSIFEVKFSSDLFVSYIPISPFKSSHALISMLGEIHRMLLFTLLNNVPWLLLPAEYKPRVG